MMDRYEALYGFWSSFGVPAYEENSVPERKDLTFPYITYNAVASPFDSDTVVNASIWTRSTSWLEADTLADAVERELKNGGKILSYATGIIWITPETPLAQSMGDPDDNLIKRKLLTVELHFY